MDQNTKQINCSRWIISLEDGRYIITFHNSTFGQAKQTSSYMIEIHASLSTLQFLHQYATYYKIQLNNKFTALSNNKAYDYTLK